MHLPPPSFSALVTGPSLLLTRPWSVAFTIMGDQRADARERVAAFVALSHAVRPGASALSGPLHLPFVCSLGSRRGSQVAHFLVFTCVIKALESPEQQKSPSSIPLFLSAVLHVFLLSLSLAPFFPSNTPSYFSFAFLHL